jgi:hypothetical protein
MPYEIYKILHLVGIFLLTSGLLTALTLAWSKQPFTGKIKSFAFMTHGLGLLFILVSGFGLLARLGLARESLPLWIYVKLTIWLIMGGIISLLKRKGHLGWPLYILLLIIFITAAYFGVYKIN